MTTITDRPPVTGGDNVDADLWCVAEKLEDIVFQHLRWMQESADVADG